MSGEAGGVVVGGLLLVGALPIVITAALVAGAAVGVGALGVAAVRAGARTEERRRQERQLEVNNCSAELSRMYSRVRDELARQDEATARYYEKFNCEMDALSARLRNAVKADNDSADLEKMLQEVRDESKIAINKRREAEFERIRTDTESETEKIVAALGEAQSAKVAAVNWQSSSVTARAGQKAMAQDMMRDAASSIHLLDMLVSSSGDRLFTEKASAIHRSYQTAVNAMEAEAYQTVVATAQQVTISSARLVIEHEQELAKMDEIRLAVESRLNSIQSELENQSVLSFEDGTAGRVDEYLDDFTQGAYSRLQEEVSDLLVEIEGDEHISKVALEQMLDRVENELAPRMERVIQMGHEKLLSYYERLHALEVVGDYMKGQGYRMDWAQTAADDVTQKLVVHFCEPISGNTVAVSLDEEDDVAEIGRMAMEVMFYYANGRPVTESEKQDLREGMMGALHAKGLSGSLSCTGQVDQEASDRTLDSVTAVRTLPASKVFRAEN